MATKDLKLRRPDRCVQCAVEIPAGVIAHWDSSDRTVTCLVCAEPAGAPAAEVVRETEVGDGVAGASIGHEHERRRALRQQRVREAHPHIGGVLLALSSPPQHEEAFRVGEAGEIAVAAALERAVGKVAGVVLHNRRMPGGRGDIDHIAIVPSGIYVIDAKAVQGKVELRRPWFKPPRLLIGGRDRTHYLDGLDRQTQAVRATLEAACRAPVPVQGALCFTHADLPLLRLAEARGHLLIYRKTLAKRLTATGSLDGDALRALSATIAAALRAA